MVSRACLAGGRSDCGAGGGHCRARRKVRLRVLREDFGPSMQPGGNETIIVCFVCGESPWCGARRAFEACAQKLHKTNAIISYYERATRQRWVQCDWRASVSHVLAPRPGCERSWMRCRAGSGRRGSPCPPPRKSSSDGQPAAAAGSSPRTAPKHRESGTPQIPSPPPP